MSGKHFSKFHPTPVPSSFILDGEITDKDALDVITTAITIMAHVSYIDALGYLHSMVNFTLEKKLNSRGIELTEKILCNYGIRRALKIRDVLALNEPDKRKDKIFDLNYLAADSEALSKAYYLLIGSGEELLI